MLSKEDLKEIDLKKVSMEIQIFLHEKTNGPEDILKLLIILMALNTALIEEAAKCELLDSVMIDIKRAHQEVKAGQMLIDVCKRVMNQGKK